jgi:hypothetical protein
MCISPDLDGNRGTTKMFHDMCPSTKLRSGDSSEDQARLAQATDGFVLHRRCPSATQHVVPPDAAPLPEATQMVKGEEEIWQPPHPAITGGTLCSSNGPL